MCLQALTPSVGTLAEAPRPSSPPFVFVHSQLLGGGSWPVFWCITWNDNSSIREIKLDVTCLVTEVARHIFEQGGALQPCVTHLVISKTSHFTLIRAPSRVVPCSRSFLIIGGLVRFAAVLRPLLNCIYRPNGALQNRGEPIVELLLLCSGYRLLEGQRIAVLHKPPDAIS
jgi:hypothetical protein